MEFAYDQRPPFSTPIAEGVTFRPRSLPKLAPKRSMPSLRQSWRAMPLWAKFAVPVCALGMLAFPAAILWGGSLGIWAYLDAKYGPAIAWAGVIVAIVAAVGFSVLSALRSRR